jgi:hypothetical protein
MNAVPLPGDEIGLSVRRCALMLHGVSAGDQAWLLERLEEPQRAQVSALLQELRTLGIPPEESAKAQQAAPKPRPKAAAQPRELVMHASAQQLAIALQGEPAMLVARLIQAGEWKWQGTFIALLAPAKRSEVQGLLDNREVPPKLGEAVVNAVAARLAVVPAPVQQKREYSASWQRWLGRLMAHGINGVRR